MSRYLILGGFEPSGHDAAVNALAEAGAEHGHQVDVLKWRDLLDIGDHPLFHFHRYALSKGAGAIAGLLDEPWIAQSLAVDLLRYIDLTYDAYVSVHPWSTSICAEALSIAEHNGAVLADYTGEFSPFPLAWHKRVNVFLGGGRPRPLRPIVRSKCHVTGVAVPKRFHATDVIASRKQWLVVSAGSDGWAINALAGPARYLSEQLKPELTLLLAPTSEAARAWSHHSIPNSKMITGCTDISPLLLQSRWYLSKAGGTSIAEGLAAGCIGYAAPSGLFWEDEALAYLSSEGIVNRVGGPVAAVTAGLESSRSIAKRSIHGAAAAVWKIVTAPARLVAHAEQAALGELVELAKQHRTTPLVDTSRLLIENLQQWLLEWKDDK